MKSGSISISVVLCFLFSITLLNAAQQQADEFSPFQFSVLGDNRPHGVPEKIIQPDIFKKAIQEINLLGSEFTVIIGDLILGYDDDKTLINAEWDEFFKTCGGFTNPYYPVVGNHDVFDKQSEKMWLKRLGPLYFAFSHKGCRFICLYSEDPEKMNFILDEQVAWLESELQEHRDAKYIFVFLHKPLWREYYFSEGSTNWMADVHPLLVKYKVNTVFAGHEHLYELSEEVDGVRYIITGGAGAEIGDIPYRGDFYHHLSVNAQDEEVQIIVIKTGSIFAQDVVTQEQVQQVDEFLESVSSESFSIRLGEAVKKTIRITPKNAFNESIIIDYSVQTPEGSGWICDEKQKQIMLEPGDSTELTFNITFDGEALFPVPENKIICTIEEEKVIELAAPIDFSIERPARIKKALGKIKIDGKLDEKSWPAVESAGRWMKTDKSGWAGEITDWYICYDNNFLYMAFDCKEDEMKTIRQTSKEKDWNFLDDDCVIFYLDPVKDGQSRFCFGITAFGVTMDYRAPQGEVDFNWDPEWDIVAKKRKDGYIIEAAVPFEILDCKIPLSGTEWGINAFRMCTPEPPELDGWSFPILRLSNPAGYGMAVFE